MHTLQVGYSMSLYQRTPIFFKMTLCAVGPVLPVVPSPSRVKEKKKRREPLTHQPGVTCAEQRCTGYTDQLDPRPADYNTHFRLAVCKQLFGCDEWRTATFNLSLLVKRAGIAGIAQSVSRRLATGWKVRGSNPDGVEIFRTCSHRPWVPLSLLYSGYRVFPRGKGDRG
jgi:hypothetical protein